MKVQELDNYLYSFRGTHLYKTTFEPSEPYLAYDKDAKSKIEKIRHKLDFVDVAALDYYWYCNIDPTSYYQDYIDKFNFKFKDIPFAEDIERQDSNTRFAWRQNIFGDNLLLKDILQREIDIFNSQTGVTFSPRFKNLFSIPFCSLTSHYSKFVKNIIKPAICERFENKKIFEPEFKFWNTLFELLEVGYLYSFGQLEAFINSRFPNYVQQNTSKEILNLFKDIDLIKYFLNIAVLETHSMGNIEVQYLPYKYHFRCVKNGKGIVHSNFWQGLEEFIQILSDDQNYSPTKELEVIAEENKIESKISHLQEIKSALKRTFTTKVSSFISLAAHEASPLEESKMLHDNIKQEIENEMLKTQ